MLTGREFEQKARALTEEIRKVMYDSAYKEISDYIDSDIATAVYLEEGAIQILNLEEIIESVKKNYRESNYIADSVLEKIEVETENKIEEDLKKMGWQVTEEGKLKPMLEEENALPSDLIE